MNQIIFSFAVLTVSNVGIGILGLPLFLSWIAGVATLVILRLLSLGQKDGHLELSIQFLILPHLYLGHGDRRRDA